MRYIIFAMIGVALEVAFTACCDWRKTKKKLLGYSYLWMFPLWAVVPLALDVLQPLLCHWFVLFRLLIYAPILMLAEYTSGRGLRYVLGQAPWEDDYRKSVWSIDSLVRIDFLPWWMFGCWFLEIIYLYLQGIPA